MSNAPTRRLSVTPLGQDAAEFEEDGAGVALPGLGAAVLEEDADDANKAAKLPARAIRNDDGSYTLPLLKPVEMKIMQGGQLKRTETVDSLRLRELNGADMRVVMQASASMQAVVTLARAADIQPKKMEVIFDRMGARDIAAATAIISFLSE